MDFKDTRALITGGSKGLGLALGRELLGRGAQVALVARDQDQLQRSVSELRRSGGRVFGIAADVSDKLQTHAIAGQAAALLSGVDLLVHNASTLGPTPLRALLDTECEDFEQVLQTNLLGPFRLSKAVVGAMLLRGSGTVLHISSDAAVEHYPTWGAYGASKAALDHLNGSFAAELSQRGLRFLSVDPGEMDTAMHAAAIPDADRDTLAAPADVARSIADLLAHRNDQTNGTRLTVAHAGVVS